LILLLGHSEVNLKAVTITPGAEDQIGLVRKVLKDFKADIPIGAFNIGHPKKCVSGWYHKVYGEFVPSKDAELGADVIYNNCNEDTTIITGAPLKNLGFAIEKYPDLIAGRLVAQGGFAGQGVVPEDKQLDKFKGRLTCPTYNFNGAPGFAQTVLNFDGIKVKKFVSKNVCHGVYYNNELHKEIEIIKNKPKYLELIYSCMNKYLQKKSDGKKFHDPLAACAAINEDIITWKEVKLFRDKGEWGAKLCKGSNIWISIDYNRRKFVKTLLGGL